MINDDVQTKNVSFPFSDGHDVNDEVSRKQPESGVIFPWNQQTREISLSYQGNGR